MKIKWNVPKFKYAIILSLFLLVSACQQMSEKETDKSAGLNGGFEISQNNLPVNWLMYSPNTVPNAEFEIVLDKTIFKEGKQSLRFDVKNCSSTGGWHSPGFTNEFTESGQFEGEGTYKLSFWIKNNGSKYRINAGGVTPMEGDMRKLIESDQQTEDWKYLEYKISVPKDWHLRMELNILQPGTFWIDDIQITKI
jgi:hypothetical protein